MKAGRDLYEVEGNQVSPFNPHPVMESHSRLRVLLFLLCLVFSIAGARPLLAPDVSPTVDPAAWSRLILEVFSTSEQATSPRLSPDVSPTPEPAASPQLAPDAEPPLAPGASPTAGPGPFPWPYKSGDFSIDDIGQLVADSPSESPAMNQAAAMVAELDGSLSPTESVMNKLSPAAAVAMNEAASVAAQLDVPPVNQMIEGVDVGAALDSLDEKTSKSLPFLGS